MDYLNNVKREAQYSNAFLPGPHDVPHRHYDHVSEYEPEKPTDPATIKEKIMQEQSRKQNAMMDLKKWEKDNQARKEEAERLAMEEQAKYEGLNDEEIKWRKEFERK